MIRIEACETGFLELSLRSTFRTHWKTIRNHKTVIVRLRAGNVWGEGEAYTLEPEAVLAALAATDLIGRDAWDVEPILAGISDHAACSAVDLALHDLLGRVAGLPAWRLLGLPPAERTSCFSIGIAEREEMLAVARARIEEGYPILKIKLTTTVDPAIIHEIRAIGGEGLHIWVDANQAFDPEEAVALARAIAPARVEIFEQPLPVGMLDAYARIRPRIEIPIFLDEEIRGAGDVARAARAGGVDGINVKLAKMGGLREALRAIHVARAHGMSVLLGCFFESSLGIAGSAQLLGLVDHVDLDSPLHVENDPYRGLELRKGAIRPPEGPGLGVERG